MNKHAILVGGFVFALSSMSISGQAQATEEHFGALAGSELDRLAFGNTSETGVQAMTDEELEETRGGYGGVYFTLFGYGDINQMGGTIPEGVDVTSRSADLVSLNLGLASLPNTGGFIQFASVVGNNNVVNNNLVLNVYFLDGGVADTSGVSSGAIFGF